MFPSRISSGLFKGTPKAAAAGTSYANSGGTGDRTASITVTLTGNFLGAGSAAGFVNGSFANNHYFGNNAATTYGFTFDFGTARIIDEAKFYQQNTTSHGVWKWQGSSNGSSWTDIGSSFTFGGAATQTQTALNGNTTAYRYYRVIGVSGTASDSPWLYEWEFKISA